MLRPILTRVDADASPPTMQLMFVAHGESVRTIDIRIRSPLDGRDACLVADAELRALAPTELELLHEAAMILRDPPKTIPATAKIARVFGEPRAKHSAFCPACSHKLGRADSPWLRDLERCPECKRQLAISFGDGALSVVVRA